METEIRAFKELRVLCGSHLEELLSRIRREIAENF